MSRDFHLLSSPLFGEELVSVFTPQAVHFFGWKNLLQAMANYLSQLWMKLGEIEFEFPHPHGFDLIIDQLKAPLLDTFLVLFPNHCPHPTPYTLFPPLLFLHCVDCLRFVLFFPLRLYIFFTLSLLLLFHSLKTIYKRKIPILDILQSI